MSEAEIGEPEGRKQVQLFWRLSFLSLFVLVVAYAVDVYLVIRSQYFGPDPNTGSPILLILLSIALLSVLAVPSLYIFAHWRRNPVGIAVALFGAGFVILFAFDGFAILLIPLVADFLLYANIQELYSKRRYSNAI